MPIVTFLHSDGAKTEFDVPVGMSLMQAALTAGIDEIIGDCGGQAMCATCHVYIDQAWLDRVDRGCPMGEDEDEMLDETTSPRTNISRLGCQIVVTDELGGLVVHLPDPAA